MQRSCNALLAVCWGNFHKVSCWDSFDLDFVLDLGDDLFKSLELRRYLDASDLRKHIRFHVNSWTINKTYLNDGEGIIGTRLLLNPLLPRSRSAELLFINSTVTDIISHSRSYYLFNSYRRDSRGFSLSNRTSVLLKFSCLQQVENYIEVIHLEYQG